MELRQLRYLVALADERHFTRAAARVHIAQPALSQQIRRLEAEVGVPLVDRTTRRVALTDAGELLVARARRAIAELDAAGAELADLAGVRTGRVVIGAMYSLGPFDVSALLAAFHELHPGVELAIREAASESLLEMLAADAVDVALLSTTGGNEGRAGLAFHRLLDEQLVVVVAEQHPLARRPHVELEQLRDEPFIVYREGAALRRIVTEAAARAGFEPLVAFESNEASRLRALAARGLGVAVIPQSEARLPGPPVATIPLQPAMTRDVSVAWRDERRHSPAARAFIALTRTAGPDGTPREPDEPNRAKASR